MTDRTVTIQVHMNRLLNVEATFTTSLNSTPLSDQQSASARVQVTTIQSIDQTNQHTSTSPPSEMGLWSLWRGKSKRRYTCCVCRLKGITSYLNPTEKICQHQTCQHFSCANCTPSDGMQSQYRRSPSPTRHLWLGTHQRKDTTRGTTGVISYLVDDCDKI